MGMNGVNIIPEGSGGGGGCFRAGTLISTPNGNIPIDRLKEGDEVWSFDESGAILKSKVAKTHFHERDTILRVDFWGGFFHITPNHWVLNQFYAFVEMGTLKVEDALVDFKNHLRPIKAIEVIGEEPVYNLTVEPHHTYIADGIRVHNGGGGGGKSSGGGGNSNTRAPKEAPNTLRSVATARVLDLLCEGPILGLVNGAQSIYFDDTPLQNSNGSYNFQGVVWDQRYGEPDQAPMPGFDSVETEHIVETEITRQLGPLVRQINNTDVDACRVRIRIPNLSTQDPKTGDLNPGSVEIKIEVKPSDGDYRNVNFIYEEDDRSGQTTTGSPCVGFRATVKKRILVKLNSIASTTLELKYRNAGGGSYTSLGARTVSKIIKTVPNQATPDGYLDGQPAYYYTFTTTYEITGLGANNYELQVAQGDELSGFLALRQTNLNISGKNTSPTEKSYRFALPGAGPWQVRVSRITADSEQVNVQNTTVWAAYTEVIEEKFIYPDSAYIGLAVNSELFGNRIPRRAYDIYGREILVPQNYDPVNKSYDGIWDGTFKVAWTDNPAWCFLDMLINDRFGLGHILTLDDVDTAKLYEISQYCDELVPDGFGGLEPRFTLNCIISTRQEAYSLLNAMASVFRGMIFWASGSVSLAQDAPREIDVIVGRANVIDGAFNYQTSSDRAQHNSVLVTWNDPSDLDRPNIEVVEDNRDIASRGLRQTDVYAFGCKSRGMAARVGRWILYTENNEIETVTYRASLDHLNVVPGMIAGVIDPQVSGADFAGRTMTISGLTVTLDRPVALAAGETYELCVIDDDGRLQYRTVTSGSGQTTAVLQIANAFDPIPTKGKMWSLFGTDVEPRPFRIISIVEVENYIFEITGVEYNPSKHDFVDREVKLEPVNFSNLNTGEILPPTNLDIRETLFKANNQTKTRVTLSWQGGQDSRVFMYKVAWRKSEGGIMQEIFTGDEAAEIIDLEPGIYDFYVFAIAAAGQSPAVPSEDHEIFGKTAPPANVENLTSVSKVNGAILSWSPVADIDVIGYEIRRGSSWDTAAYVADIVGTSIFVDIETSDPETFLVRAKDELENLSTGISSITVTVVPPDTPSVFTATAQADFVLFRWSRVAGLDNIYEIRRGSSWALAETIGESANDELLILDPVRTDSVYWIKAKSTNGLFSTNARAASAQRALIPDRNIIIEYDNANDGGAGAYPGFTFNMEAGPDDSLVLEEISAGLYQPHGEHYFEHDLGSVFRARNWLETQIINIAGGGPTWAEWAYAWQDPESQIAWLPLQDLDGAALEKVIAWKRDPLDEELYAWGFQDSLFDFRSEPAASSDHVTYSTAKFGNGLFVSDLTHVEYDISLDFTFTLTFKIRVESPLDNKRIFCVLKNDAEGDRIEIGYDDALGENGAIYALDSDGAMIYIEITQSVPGLNFLSVGLTQNANKRALYYRSEREYLSLYEEADLAPLENTFDKLYMHNEP